MRKFAALCLVTGMLFTLTACCGSYNPVLRFLRDKNTTTTTTVEHDATSTSPTDSAPTTTAGSTTVSSSNRLVKILRADFPYFDGPGYDYSPIGTVEEAGTYTIVEEVSDAEGNRWGKLKSGVGWVDLSLIEKESQNMPPVTVAKASQAILNSGNYHYCQADTSSYAYNISISAHEPLSNVSFFSINSAENYERGATLFRTAQMDSSKPLVASVYFPGSTSLYGLEFIDQNGNVQIYTISESGRNGGVDIAPFTGTLSEAKPSFASWQAAYLSHIESLAEEKTACEFSLVYVDSDDIPELFISGSCEASGSQFCSYRGGKLLTIGLDRLGGVRYIPQSSLVYNSSGSMGYYSVEIYRLSDSGFTCIFYGVQEEDYEEIAKEDGTYEYITRNEFYIVKDGVSTPVTAGEYYAAQNEVFDSSKARSLGYGTYDYNAICEQLADR